MSKELYKRHRPKTLKDMVGNEATVRTLMNMLKRQTLPHTCLFHGPSGCGKTTLARILAKELGCSQMDLRELNCSDFRGVDTIRDIARKINMAPTGGDCKIWLMDEVHQMTKDAQNAALKILEDTPSHVYFFLCTTDPQKIIKTIRTRCCEIPVERLSTDLIKKLVAKVLKRERETLDMDMVADLTDAADGSPRRALVILDRVLNLPPEDRAAAIKEDPEEKEVIDLCQALLRGKSWSTVARILKDLKAEPESVRHTVLGYARTCILGNNKATQERAAVIIDTFADHFYDSKAAGLALACYDVIGK